MRYGGHFLVIAMLLAAMDWTVSIFVITAAVLIILVQGAKRCVSVKRNSALSGTASRTRSAGTSRKQSKPKGSARRV
jgi:predicted peroxiredoxin